jgi:hypothetical protein
MFSQIPRSGLTTFSRTTVNQNENEEKLKCSTTRYLEVTLAATFYRQTLLAVIESSKKNESLLIRMN